MSQEPDDQVGPDRQDPSEQTDESHVRQEPGDQEHTDRQTSDPPEVLN